MVDTVHPSAICATDAPLRERASGYPAIFWLASPAGRSARWAIRSD